MVREWVKDPAANKGLLLNGEETELQTGRNFAATENTNGLVRPKLVVRYTLRPPPK